jgi:hypothetical protein
MAPPNQHDVHGTGGPSPNTIIGQDTLTPARPRLSRAAAAVRRQTYQILMTDQTDPYDRPITRAEAATFAPAGDNFGGKDRMDAKLSIATSAPETFTDLQDLIDSLLPDASMTGHSPPITKDPTSGRTPEEERNVRVQAFLYAASREADNDFHLIIGRDPNSPPAYMTMEISGLPPATNPDFAQIKQARDAYKEFFGTKLPGPAYHFYRPPIPVEIAGSLFFDITHATGGHPGPADLRPDIPTIWEVHPVTDIVFEP